SSGRRPSAGASGAGRRAQRRKPRWRSSACPSTPPRMPPDPPATALPSNTPATVSGHSISARLRPQVSLLQSLRRTHIDPAAVEILAAYQPPFGGVAQQRRQGLRALSQTVEQPR